MIRQPWSFGSDLVQKTVALMDQLRFVQILNEGDNDHER